MISIKRGFLFKKGSKMNYLFIYFKRIIMYRDQTTKIKEIFKHSNYYKIILKFQTKLKVNENKSV